MAEAEVALRRERTTAEYRDSLGIVSRTPSRSRASSIPRRVGPTQRATAGCRECAGRCRAIVAACGEEASPRRGVALTGAGARASASTRASRAVLHPVVENACVTGAAQCVWRWHVRADGAVLGQRRRPRRRGPEQVDLRVGGARQRRTPTSSGAGLGLALARRLARAASGRRVARPPGGRGQFVVRLPAA
jgi:hypothetical protein